MQPPDATLSPASQPVELDPVVAPRARTQRSPLARLRERASLWHVALAGVLGLASVLDLRRLSQNGYANTFYSAGVKSELMSLHNFLFVSFDPGGLGSIDKPPLGMWLQVVSAKIFGFSPMSLLVPEAVAGVLSVAVLYLLVARCFGAGAGVASALVLAVFPSFVAISRDNGPDPLLILLMLLACGAALRAVESGRWRWLLASGVLVGLAFNTKTLAALLVVPGAGLAYLVCAERGLARRIVQLVVAGVVLAVVAFAWIEFVDVTPASQRPFVGGSTDNSEFNLTFGYNGFGRVGGQVGGPGRVPVIPMPTYHPPSQASRHGHHTASKPAPLTPAQQARLDAHNALLAKRRANARNAATSGVQPIPRTGHATKPSSFGGSTGFMRLFSRSLGGQDGWLLPFAVIGLLAIALTVRGRRDRRLAGLIVFGGWFATEGLVLSFSKGIVHPYYVAALGPGVGALVGAGAWAMSDLVRRANWRGAVLPLATRLLLPAFAAGGTLLAQYVLLRREHYLHAFLPFLFAAVAIGVLTLLLWRRVAAPAMALVLGALLVAPAAYASTVWEIPVQGTFPAAGPHAAGGSGGLEESARSALANTKLVRYVTHHHPGSRWAVLTVASDSAAPLILMGLHAGALGGYSGTDPSMTGPGLARLVQLGEARYVLLGGAYSDRGGNAAISAVRADCTYVPSEIWRHVHLGGTNALTLFDCRHRETQLRGSP